MPTPSTFRHDIVAGLVTMLNTVKTANPTLLLAVYAARPEGFPDLPAAFVDSRPENVRQDSGTRTRLMSPSIVIVRRLTNNAEAMAAFDVLVDLVTDAITANPQFATDTIHPGEFSIADEEYDYGDDYKFAAVRFSLSNISIMEGRA